MKMNHVRKPRKVEIRIIDGEESRRCTTCNTWQPFSNYYFHGQVNRSLPIGSKCKPCEQTRMKKYSDKSRTVSKTGKSINDLPSAIHYPAPVAKMNRGINGYY